ncbi:MAG: oligosaccharide flippase family protein [Halieaceae bacterium]
MLNSKSHPRLTLAATQALCEGSAFLRNLILARLVGADQMGIAVALALGIRIFEMAGEFGIDRLLVQVEAAALPRMRRVIHLLQLLKGGTVTAVAILLALPVSETLNPEMDSIIFAVAALSLLIRGASNCDYRERQRSAQFRPAMIVEGGSNFLAALAAAPLAWILRDYTVLAWVLLLQATLFCVLSHVVATHPYSVGFDRQLFRRCLRYGVPIALNGALMFLALQGDRLIVAVHFSAAELARFALAAQLTLLPALIGARYLLASELPRLGQLSRERAGFDDRCMGLLHRVGALAVGGALALGITGNTLVGWLYGEAYQVTPAIFWLLAAGAGIRLIRAVPGTALMALEATHLLFLSNLPRLLTLAAALWTVSSGGSLETLVAISVFGEALSLGVALLALIACRVGVAGSGDRPLMETV